MLGGAHRILKDAIDKAVPVIVTRLEKITGKEAKQITRKDIIQAMSPQNGPMDMLYSRLESAWNEKQGRQPAIACQLKEYAFKTKLTYFNYL